MNKYFMALILVCNFAFSQDVKINIANIPNYEILKEYKISSGQTFKSVLNSWCSNEISPCRVVYEVKGISLKFSNNYSIKKYRILDAVDLLINNTKRTKSALDYRYYTKNNLIRICEVKCK